MIKAIFAWFDTYPATYWVLAALATAAWLSATVLLVYQGKSSPVPRRARAALPWLILATLFAWRWPFLLATQQFSPDESQQIAGALTLLHDPVFWRSVDGATAGPLDFYVLLPSHWAGLPLDFFSARLTGLLLVWGMLINCRRILCSQIEETAAWVALMPGVAFFAAVPDWDFIHYSTEHLPLYLLTAALAGVMPSAAAPSQRLGMQGWRWFCAGAAAGALPWAKLQAAPLAPLAFAVAIAYGLRGSHDFGYKRVAWFAGGFVAPTLAILAMVFSTGQLGTAWESYLISNFTYVSLGLPWLFLFQQLWLHTSPSFIFPAFVVATSVWTLAGAGRALLHRARPSLLAWVATVLMAACCVIVLLPRRDFPHYLLFLVPAALLLGGLGVAEWLAPMRTRHLTCVLVCGVGLLPMLVRPPAGTPFTVGQLSAICRHPHSEVGVEIRRLSAPGDSLVVWGWRPQLHVETGLPQGTRDAHSQRQIEVSQRRDFHRSLYLANFLRSQPRFFVDAVGPGAFGFSDRALAAHETFPELAAHIKLHYHIHAEIGAARVYVRTGPPTS